MLSKDIVNIRRGLGMTQVEFAKALGVGAQTVSQWEIGYRKPSSLALRAVQMLSELGSMENVLREKLQRDFNRLNAEWFGNQIKRGYEFQFTGRMKRVKAMVLPSKRLVKFSRFYLLGGGDVESTLKHEMVHIWLYERGRPWGHTREFKAKLKAIGGELKAIG